MQPYDLVMVAVLTLATVWGVWKGMAWQIASLASLALSYLVALRFSEQLAPHISADAPWNRFLAMLVLYLGTSLAIWLGFRFVSSMIDRVQLKEFDRQVGGLFGLAKGVLLCVAITFFAVTLSADARQMVLKSRSGYYIALLIDRAEPVMPKEIDQVLRPYLDKLNHQLDPANADEPGRGVAEPRDAAPAQEEPREPSLFDGFDDRLGQKLAEPSWTEAAREAAAWQERFDTGRRQ